MPIGMSSREAQTRNAKRRNHEAIAACRLCADAAAGLQRAAATDQSGATASAAGRAAARISCGRRFPASRERELGFRPRVSEQLSIQARLCAGARAAGLTRDQIVGVYAFETGGKGAYDTQAGLEPPRPGAHAISPAIGYNQLLSTNTSRSLPKRPPLSAGPRGQSGGSNRRRKASAGEQDRRAPPHDRLLPQPAAQLERL